MAKKHCALVRQGHVWAAQRIRQQASGLCTTSIRLGCSSVLIRAFSDPRIELSREWASVHTLLSLVIIYYVCIWAYFVMFTWLTAIPIIKFLCEEIQYVQVNAIAGSTETGACLGRSPFDRTLV